MAIYTMHVNGPGLGDFVVPSVLTALRSGAITGSGPTLPSGGALPQSTPAPPGSQTLPDGSTLLPDGTIAPPGVFSSGDFISTWGLPIAAGAGAFIVGVVIAKFTVGRKK